MNHKRAVTNSRRLLRGRLSAYLGIGLGAVFMIIAAGIFIFGGAILTGYVKGKVERAFAKAHPGFLLQIGELHYALGDNRLVAQTVTLRATNSMYTVGRISLTGVRWARLLWGKTDLAQVFARVSLEAIDLDLENTQSQYGIRCARLQASAADSELIAAGTELRTLVTDEQYFANRDFRTTRFRVVVPECSILGVTYDEMLRGKSYRARSVHLLHPSFEALVNRDKPVGPLVKPPLMIHEALAAILKPLQVDSLNITNAHILYSERRVAGADPGVLTFTAVNISVEDLANRGKSSDAIKLHAQGKLMDAGVLKVRMTIPIASPDFSFHYSGSLSAMDLTRLNAFLEIAERTRIKSGYAQEASFDVNVASGQARGDMRGIYKNLTIAVLDKNTGSEKGLTSFFANLLKIRTSNTPEASGSRKEGAVNYARRPQDTFLKFAWFSLRSGVLDVISH